MAGEDTVVPVTTLSGCYSEHRIDHATDFCESTSAVPQEVHILSRINHVPLLFKSARLVRKP